MRLRSTTNSTFSVRSNILNVKIDPRLRSKYLSDISFIDDAFGMGFTPSCVCLFTGEPGAGKSTLMLELADALSGKDNAVYYNSAEEAQEQISMTCERLKLKNGFIPGCETDTEQIIRNCDAILESNEYKGKQLFLIIDSLQTLSIQDAMNPITCLERLTDYAKEKFINVIVIGQVNKSGTMAGSQKLKHIVDAMLHLSVYNKPPKGDEPDMRGFRLLTVEKNRFGSNGWTFFLDLDQTGFQEIARIGVESRNISRKDQQKLEEKSKSKEELLEALSTDESSDDKINEMKEKFEKIKKDMMGV